MKTVQNHSRDVSGAVTKAEPTSKATPPINGAKSQGSTKFEIFKAAFETIEELTKP